MNPVIAEFVGMLVKTLAREVAEHIKELSQPGTATPAVKDEVFKPEIASDLSPSDARGECLAIINKHALKDGTAIRAALALFGAKRLGEVQDTDIVALLAELARMNDA